LGFSSVCFLASKVTAEAAVTTTSKPGTTKGPISPPTKRKHKKQKLNSAPPPKKQREVSLREQIVHNLLATSKLLQQQI